MFKRLLIVCAGNICRSPVAAAMLRKRLPDLQVHSAGLGAVVGNGVEPKAKYIAESAGLDVEEHHARQLDTRMLTDADLVLVMSEGQRQELVRRWPEMRGKTLLMGKWLIQNESIDIPDPYHKSTEVFEHVHRLLQEATRLWAQRL